MFVHKCMNQVTSYFDIIVKVKFMCPSYVMYDVHSCGSKDTNIICIVSDCGMDKRQYSSRGVHYN